MKEPKIYKGEVVELSALQPTEQGIPVEVVSGQKQFYPEAPKFGVVSSISKHPYNPDYVQVQLKGWQKKKFRTHTVDFPAKDKPFKVLTGTTKDKLLQYLTDSVKTGFVNHLAGVGHGFTIGSDPEWFVLDEKNEIIPAFTYLPKKHPSVNAFWDGFQAEYRTGAGSCLDGQTSAVMLGMAKILYLARKLNPKAKLSLVDVIQIPKKLLVESAEEYVALGCAPSENIYNTPPIDVPDPRTLDIRTAGAHMHFGTKNVNPNNVKAAVSMLDAIIGVGSVSLFEGMENPIRRKFYGRAGEYRLPRHGLEYRTLGPGWTCSPAIMHLVWDTARYALRAGLLGLRPAVEGTDEEIRDIINNYDVKDARAFLKRNKAVLDALVNRVYYNGPNGTKAVECWMNGASVIMKDPMDVMGNWDLDNIYRSMKNENTASFTGKVPTRWTDAISMGAKTYPTLRP